MELDRAVAFSQPDGRMVRKAKAEKAISLPVGKAI
jgi:hypothetical protein